MSDHQPPSGQPEYLDAGGGAPLPPLAPDTTPEGGAPARRSHRGRWLVAGGAVGLLAVGAGAWAALSFFQQGTQPAAELPSTTIAYLSIDLDPSGGQKIDAFRTLDKFPAFKDKAGIHSVGDVRRKIGEAFLDGNTCHLTYDSDVGPWLGDRLAVAAVDLGQPDPSPVFVLQVTDDGKAVAGIKRLNSCDSHSHAEGYVVHDGWAVLAETQALAQKAVSETKDASLADDATYQRWTKAVGDAGVVNAYAAPAAGDYLAGKLDFLGQAFQEGFGQGFSGSHSDTSQSGIVTSAFHTSSGSSGIGAELRDFQGAAATLRFTGSGLELAAATDPGLTQGGVASDQGGTVISALPDDTAAAFGAGLPHGWLSSYLDRALAGSPETGGLTRAQVYAEVHHATGLTLPGDVETLLGSSFALSVGKGLDPQSLANAPDPSQVPVALTVKGDPAAIEKVLDKIRSRAPEVAAELGSDSRGDLVAIGPSADYRQEVLAGGHLGDTDAFGSVVPRADSSSEILFVDMDSLETSLSQTLGDDPEVLDNITPLQAFGLSAWTEGGVAHTSFEISTH